jgi:TIR domain
MVLRGQEEVAEYDVYLSYHWQDKDAARSLARQLRNRGLRPWMDERQLRPGAPWQPELAEIIARVRAAAVVIGAQRGPWQTREIYAFIQQSVSRGCAIVPMLLPDADTADLPVFLQGLTWVNLAVPQPDPIDQLVWGITGQHGLGLRTMPRPATHGRGPRSPGPPRGLLPEASSGCSSWGQVTKLVPCTG